MTTRTRKLVVLSLVLLVALAGCSGMGGNDAAKENGNYDTGRSNGGGSGSGNGGDGQADGGSPSQSALVVQQRMLIRTGDLSLSVESFENASQVLTEIARERGGFVSDSSQRVHRRGRQEGHVGGEGQHRRGAVLPPLREGVEARGEGGHGAAARRPVPRRRPRAPPPGRARPPTRAPAPPRRRAAGPRR